MSHRETRLDTERGKLLGVCASLAAAGGIAPLLVRVLAVAAMLWAFKLTVVCYCLAAIILRWERR